MSGVVQVDDVQGYTLGREDGVVSYLNSTLEGNEDEIDIATYFYCGDVDAGMFRTIVYDALGDIIEESFAFSDDEAVRQHDFLVEKYIPGAVTEGLCTPLEEFAWFSELTRLPWRPSFALVGVESWV